jgi:hypothetical protein
MRMGVSFVTDQVAACWILIAAYATFLPDKYKRKEELTGLAVS